MRIPRPKQLLATAALIWVAAVSLARPADPFPGTLPGSDIAGLLPPGSEPSGAVWHPRLETLFIVSDGGVVASIGDDGTSLTSWTVPGDLEAITIADPAGPFVYIGVEDPDSILEFDLALGVVTRTFDVSGTMTGTATRGLESLTFVDDPLHPEGGLFYAGLQDDGRVYVFDLPVATSTSSTAVDHVSTFAPVAGRDDLSGLDWVGSEATLYAIYDGDDLLRTMQADGTLIGEWGLPGTEQEGVAVRDCLLFVAHDTPAALMRYAYPTNPIDQDADGRVDCVDNCPLAANASQGDLDSDGAGDLCDCAPANASASSLPGDVRSLTVSRGPGGTELAWIDQAPLHDVAIGIVSDLRAGGDTTAALCLQDDVSGGSITPGAAAPAPGDGDYYLVRGQNVCGSGSYGSTSAAVERALPAACP